MRKIILDLDTGIDDAMALAMAIDNKDKFDLIGITATFGNTNTETSAENSLRILNHFGISDIPVFEGCRGLTEEEVYQPSDFVKRIHGINGLGNVDFPKGTGSIEKTHAVEFLHDAIIKYNEELVIVPTGTLSNIAALYRKYPELLEYRPKYVAMGGAVSSKGNVTPTSEANMHKDPESAAFILSLGLDFTLIPLDVTQRLRLSISDIAKWEDEKFKAMVTLYINWHGTGESYLHDPSCIAYLLDEAAFTTLPLRLKADSEGRTFADPDADTFVNVALCVDKERAEKTIKDSLNRILGFKA